MNSPQRSHVTRRPWHLGSHLTTAVALLLTLAAPRFAAAAASHIGKWTPAHNVDDIAVHLSLLPSPSPGSYHSKIVFWNHGHHFFDENSFAGKVWNWSPTVQDACASWPSSNFSEQELDPPGFDIFCAVSQVTQGGDLFVVGGTEIGEAGTRETAVFRASDNSWESSGTMQYGRWYAGLAALPDGRTMVSSGSLYDHFWIYGGKASGTTIGDLNRFGANLNANWDAAIPKTSGWPEERSGHAATGEMTIFGGRDANGEPLNDVWDMNVTDNETSAEYAYPWTVRSNLSGDPPRARQRTAAVKGLNDTMWVICGIGRNAAGSADSVLSDVWRMHKSGFNSWTWAQITPSGSGPGARYGHSAVFDAPRNRVLLYGGAGTAAAAATDSAVYALSLGASPAWSTPNVRNGTKPPPRLGHAMLFDRDERNRDTVGTDVVENRVVMFGGQSQEGSGFSNELWHLWIAANGDLEWMQPDTLGPGLPPAPRAWLTLSRSGTRTFVFGGDTLNGPAQGQLYEFEVPEPNAGWDATPGTWRTLASRTGGGLSGASMVALTNKPVFPRYSEIATAGNSGSWQTLGGPLLQEWYPAMWTLPTQSGASYKVFFAGPSFKADQVFSSYLYDLGNGSWTKFPASGAASDTKIKGGAAVLYRPGRVMKCGTRDTEGRTTIATTKTAFIDLTAGSPAWTASDTMRSGRVNHNLTLLPTGEVLVTGGTGIVDNGKLLSPRLNPEIWGPDSLSGTGEWYRGPGDSLAPSPAGRDYHSTAILLPDGRVLTAGGNANDSLARLATIYCPPYLFKHSGTDSVAPRPVINSLPTAVTWGKTFTVCVDDTAGITRVSLLAPGATTHGQDQNQRFIPLTFTRSPYGHKLYVTAPADSNVAPPGYYLVFVTGAKDGGVHYKDVPSIAKWIRVKRDLRDTCDTIRPAIQSDFAVDVVGTTSVDLSWTEPGDDSTAAASGLIQQFDVRWSAAAITQQSHWDNANSWSGEPAPAGAGTGQAWTKSGLSSCTRYYVANRAPDDNLNVSLLHGSVTFKTLGSGCGVLLADGGSGAARMERSRPPRGSSLHGMPVRSDGRTASTATGEATGAGPLVVETSAGEAGGWSVTASRVSTVAGIDGADADAILVQIPNGSGGWRTVNRISASTEEDLAGLCALRDGGRFVLPSQYSIEAVAPSLGNGAGALEAGTVTHSTDGELGSSAFGDPAATELEVGETLTTTYAAVTGNGEAAESWHLLVRRNAGSSGIEQGGSGSAAILPTRFALMQNAPNPFSATTSVEFHLPQVSHVKIELFDLLGRRVRTLTDQSWPAGRHAVTWDRTTDRGERLSSGVLLYRMTAEGFRDQKKMVIGAR